MTPTTGNTIMVVATVIIALCAVGALCLNFWKTPKPIEAKLAILFILAQVTCTAAVGLACYFLIATDRIFPVFLCTLYNFLVQAALFGPWSRSPAFRAEFLAIVTAALALAMFSVGAFMKTWINIESRIVDTEATSFLFLVGYLIYPPASPSPPASPTPHQ